MTMRSKGRIAVVALVVMFTLGALASASASAASPEFRTRHVTFTAKSGPVTFTRSGAGSMECGKGVTLNGEITGTTTVSATLDLLGCSGGGQICRNNAGGEAVIESEPLTGTLGYLRRNPLKVGLELGHAKFEAGKPSTFAKFTCSGFAVELKGLLVGSLTPIDLKTNKFELSFAQSGGIQEFNRFSGAPAGEQLSWHQGVTVEKFGLQAKPTVVTSVEDEVYVPDPVGPPVLQPKAENPFPLAFISAGGKTTLAMETNGSMVCTGETGSGTFTGVGAGKVTIKLTGCKFAGVNCGNKGEVTTKELKSILAYTLPVKTTSEGRETGLALAPASGEVIAEFSCSVIKLVVKGSLITVVSPLNSERATFSLAIKQTGFHQEPSEYETEAGGKVTTGMTCIENTQAPVKCGIEELTPTFTLTGENALIEA